MFLFAPIRWAFKLVYFALLAAIVYLIVSGFQVVFASRLPAGVDAVGPAQAIVVLGAPMVADAPGPDYISRLEQGLALYDAKRAPTVVVTGATSPGATATSGAVPGAAAAAAGKRWLVASGVPASRIVTVPSGDAAAGLVATSQRLGQGRTVIVVTDALDALWTKGEAAHVGLKAQISPATGSERPVYNEPGQLWRQASGVAVGRILGYARSSWADQ